MKVLGGEEANVVEIASHTPVERLVPVEEHYDRHATTVDDVNAFFPITHLQDLAEEGTIGGLPPRFQKIFPNYSHRVTMSRDAPEVLAQLRADRVDAAILVPVCPICHQTVGLVARHLETNGIPTVTFSCARDITETVLPPRSVFLDYPLGSTCGRPNDPANQRAVILTGLRLLETGRTPGDIVDLPYMWSADESWKRLIFSPEQAFLSEEAETRRQEALGAARQAKRRAKATLPD